jgi:hypothetical protein
MARQQPRVVRVAEVVRGAQAALPAALAMLRPLAVGAELAQAGQAFLQAAVLMRRPQAAPVMPQAAWVVRAVLQTALRLGLAARRQRPTRARRICRSTGRPTLRQTPRHRRRTRPL